MADRRKLASFLKKVIEWPWDEFVMAEKNKKYSTNQAIVFSLVRACAMQKIEAIKMSLDRMDGKLKTPIVIETPKVYYVYPYAEIPPQVSSTSLPPPPTPTEEDTTDLEAIEGELLPPPSTDVVTQPTPPSLGLRDTLRLMADQPRELPEAILTLANEADKWARGYGPKPPEIPKVKSVIAANLLTMAQQRSLDALYEVFDQIDGKLVETLQILGEDVYITVFSREAPPGAYLNADGMLQIEATSTEAVWSDKLKNLVK